jgi:hypothetical protein
MLKTRNTPTIDRPRPEEKNEVKYVTADVPKENSGPCNKDF